MSRQTNNSHFIYTRLSFNCFNNNNNKLCNYVIIIFYYCLIETSKLERDLTNMVFSIFFCLILSLIMLLIIQLMVMVMVMMMTNIFDIVKWIIIQFWLSLPFIFFSKYLKINLKYSVFNYFNNYLLVFYFNNNNILNDIYFKNHNCYIILNCNIIKLNLKYWRNERYDD